jgi:glycosyltransferase involved in cell wall biosynthesis
VKTVLCCHLYRPDLFVEYTGLVDRFVIHRNYPIRHSESVIIPLGCPVYHPPVDRDRLRASYPAGSTVLTTIGFLTWWKKLPEIATAMLNAMARHPSLFLHMHTPRPYYADDSVLQDEAKLRGIFGAHEVGERTRFTTDFLPDTETLNLAYAADLGFLYHPIHTESVSAATKQFVSARRPLVVTGSTHAWDLNGGIERVDGFDAWTFAHKTVELALDRNKRASLTEEMKAEYERMNMHTVAQQYIDLFGSIT